MTVAGRPWSRRSASAGDALLRPRLSRRPAQLSLPLRPAARPELRRVPDRAHARGARDPAWHRSGARAVVRRRVLARVRGAWRHRIRIGRLAGAVPSVDRAQRRRPRDPVRPVSAWPAPPGLPAAGAQSPARPQARGLPGVRGGGGDVRGGVDPLHRTDPRSHSDPGRRPGERGARGSAAHRLLDRARRSLPPDRAGARPLPRLVPTVPAVSRLGRADRGDPADPPRAAAAHGPFHPPCELAAGADARVSEEPALSPHREGWARPGPVLTDTTRVL